MTSALNISSGSAANCLGLSIKAVPSISSLAEFIFLVATGTSLLSPHCFCLPHSQQAACPFLLPDSAAQSQGRVSKGLEEANSSHQASFPAPSYTSNPPHQCQSQCTQGTECKCSSDTRGPYLLFSSGSKDAAVSCVDTSVLCLSFRVFTKNLSGDVHRK